MRHLLGTAQRPWPLRGAVLLLGAVLVLMPRPALAATPTVTVSPDSGGPGVRVTLRGTGFCGAPACGTVTVTMGGYQVGGGLRPDSAGAFTLRFVVPGGLSSGQIYVIAKQTHDDGNEAQAMSGFLYSPSKGEEAERKAEEAETLQRLVDPTRPAANRGVPLASTLAQQGASGSGSTDAAASLDGARAAARTDSGHRWWLYALGVGAVAAVAALALLVRRRNRADAIVDPRG